MTVTATATDRHGISRVELLVNGRVAGKDSSPGYTFRIKTWKHGKKLTVRLRAYDKAGNARYTPARTWNR